MEDETINFTETMNDLERIAREKGTDEDVEAVRAFRCELLKHFFLGKSP